MKKVDPKYINVPNICFSLTKKHDTREEEFSEQRIKRGFDDSETWALTDTFCNFMIPRLERYIEIINETEGNSKFLKKCKKLLKALTLISRDSGSQLFNKNEKKIIKNGLKVFPKIFLNLNW